MIFIEVFNEALFVLTFTTLCITMTLMTRLSYLRYKQELARSTHLHRSSFSSSSSSEEEEEEDAFPPQ